MRDPFGERRGKFQWKVLGEKLAMLRENNPQWFAEVRFKSASDSNRAIDLFNIHEIQGGGENLGSEESELSDTS